jgi:hypothetical protein
VDKEIYLKKIIKEIEIAKEKNRKGVFKINEKIDDNSAKYIKEYLDKNTDYRIKFERCSSCTRTWDIIIIF